MVIGEHKMKPLQKNIKIYVHQMFHQKMQQQIANPMYMMIIVI